MLTPGWRHYGDPEMAPYWWPLTCIGRQKTTICLCNQLDGFIHDVALALASPKRGTSAHPGSDILAAATFLSLQRGHCLLY